VPQLALGDDHDDRPDEGDEHRRQQPPARGDAQGPEDPAPHNAPDQIENQNPDQPVLLRVRGAVASASPLTISLDFIPISHYKLYSK